MRLSSGHCGPCSCEHCVPSSCSETPPLTSMEAEASSAMRVSASEPRSCTAKLPVPHSGASRMLFLSQPVGPSGTGANDGSPVTDTLWPGVTVSSVLMPASWSSVPK